MVAIWAKEASVRGRVFCFGEVYSALMKAAPHPFGSRVVDRTRPLADLQDQLYERAEGARKRTLAEGAGIGSG